MAHGNHHSEVPGCFGCQVSGVGYQGLKSRHGSDPVEAVPVVADEGARAGRPVGQSRVHWDGRQDATVFAPLTKLETKATEF
jgi:hypothetical protein